MVEAGFELAHRDGVHLLRTAGDGAKQRLLGIKHSGGTQRLREVSGTDAIDVSTSEHYKVDELGVRVDVPAGHFEDCVQIEARNPQGPNLSLIADQVYCPGVGLVRVVTFQERSGNRSAPQFMQELASYKVAP